MQTQYIEYKTMPIEILYSQGSLINKILKSLIAITILINLKHELERVENEYS